MVQRLDLLGLGLFFTIIGFFIINPISTFMTSLGGTGLMVPLMSSAPLLIGLLFIIWGLFKSD